MKFQALIRLSFVLISDLNCAIQSKNTEATRFKTTICRPLKLKTKFHHVIVHIQSRFEVNTLSMLVFISVLISPIDINPTEMRARCMLRLNSLLNHST